MLVVKPSSHENFAPLTDEQVGSLYAAVGNHEGKALVLGGMVPNYGYRAKELHQDLLVAPQGKQPAFVGSNNPYEWAQDSFVKHGLAREEKAEFREYYLTDFGRNEGQALAGWQLDLSLNSPEAISLRSLMGMSKTSAEKSTRPPLDRLSILSQLLNASSINADQLAEKVNLPVRTMLNSIEAMSKQGIVSYDSFDASKLPAAITYEILDAYIPSVNGGGMREAIFGTLIEMQKNGDRIFTVEEFFPAVERLYKGKNFNKNSHRKHAYQLIREMITSGILSKTTSPEFKSEIALSPFMKNVVGQLIEISDGVRENHQDFRREGEIKLDNILADHNKVKTVVSKAFNNSPEANGLSLEVRQKAIASFVENNPGASLKQIAEGLEGQGLTKNSVRETLSSLRKKGKLVAVPKKGANTWHLAD